jgi:2-oxoglutarate ferredoxin oxidoreductase subunit delta
MSHAPTGTKSRAPEAITIDLGLCKSCGICSEFCPQDVFDTNALGHPVVVRLADCTVCSFCERHCPDFAIEIVRGAERDPTGGGEG